MAAPARNPRAIFVLSPPRSGSTLLRVMLAGHPRLFAPQELELLAFDTLAERRAAFTGRNRFWLEGAVRAVMAIRGCDADAARRVVEEGERQGLTTAAFYRWMQEAIAPRILVDKTPSYALDLEVLRRAEALFEAPRYLHLLRHPCGMIASFEEARLDQLYRVFFTEDPGLGPREMAELVWLVSHQNILAFLAEVPAERQHRVRFEDLVTRPAATMAAICRFLELELHPDMLDPYRDPAGRMTDGLHAASRMLGDVKFHQHRGIDPGVAERWRGRYAEAALGEPTRELAERLGYPCRAPRPATPPAGALTPIRPLPRDGRTPLPLSFAQQRLWFLDRLTPGLVAYNILKVMRLGGALDVATLERSVAEVLRRHEGLRSGVRTVDGTPEVVLAAPVSRLPIPVVDLSALDPAGRAAEVARRAAAEAQRPFDLAAPPLLRLLLLRLGPEEHVLVLTVHHLVCDGWSFDVLFRELGAAYSAVAAGRAPALPPLPVQYADVAAWQRARLARELEADLAYWGRALAGPPPVLALPTDRPRPPVQTYRGARLMRRLPPPLVEALAALGRREGATLFMTLLAGFATLLHRYTGQEDFVIGTPVAGRSRPELESLVGVFANTLPLRTNLAGAPTFRGLLARVRQATVEAFAHQEVPFERLVEALQPARDMSHHPLFQVMLALQNVPQPPARLGDLTMTPIDVDPGTAMFDLTLYLFEREGGLLGVWEYNTDLFDRATIARMAGHLETVLAGAVAEPDRPVGHLPLLTPEERHALVVARNATACAVPAACVHHLVEAQVDRTPDAVAVVVEGATLTYRALDARANRLAHHLRAAGVGPETLVGICLPPSLDLVVALLGVLKAGGAYVPLDPAYPRERLAFMLEDAGVTLVVTQAALMAALGLPAARTVCLDADADAIAARPATRPASGVMPQNLAYVIYTSGSTGRPKGVQIPHAAVVNFLESMRREPGLTAEDRLLSVTTLSFDIAALELYLPLVVGAQVQPVSRAVAADGARLAALIDAWATVVQATPATWRLLLAAGWEGCGRLTALSGGEALPVDLARALLARCARLWNMYGPTETTIWSAVHPVRPEDAPVPLGHPIANTQLYLLDRWLEPVPVGVPGELYIGGAGLARGYRGRPDLTAERFVPDPFGPPGARLYRTGDLVRVRADGALEFLGRVDHQVKVRGVRIELGEIEARLREHPAVREAVVVAREDAPGDRRLVAYVVPRGAAPGVSELRGFLARALPDAMIPAAFVVLGALPLTPNGKVDRRALPPPAPERPDLGAYVAPTSELERTIAGVWQEVLGVAAVGVHDNFFDLGGHSLLLVQAQGRLEQVLGRRLAVVELFQYPTVAALALHLARAEAERPSFAHVRARAARQRAAAERAPRTRPR